MRTTIHNSTLLCQAKKDDFGFILLREVAGNSNLISWKNYIN